MCLRRIVAIVLASSLALPLPASAMWSLGANLGVTFHDPSDEGDDTTTLVGIPTQTSPFGTLRPGLRIGYAGEALQHEGFLDASYDAQYIDDFDIHAMRLGANYQYNFSPGASMRPYLTAGVGILNLGGDFGFASVGATSLTYGGGVGLGFPVSDNAGRLRVEARADRIDEGEDDGDVVIGEATVINVTFGFDLWLR
jgi:Outer membrane protein beta-barrel domain